MSDKCVVVWSGGCDSTKLLDDWAKYGSEKAPIYAVSVNHGCVGSYKTKKEKKTREKLKKIFAKKGYHIKYFEVNIDVNNETFMGGSSGGGIHQCNLWIGNLMPFIPDNSRVAFGYISGDCFWHYKEHVNKIHDAMKLISGIKNVKIEFPLEWESKEDIIQYLKKEGLYDHVWWCENPSKKGEKCKLTCNPCKTHDTALYNLRRDKILDKNNEIIKPKKVRIAK